MNASSVEEQIGKLLLKNQLSLATAESCTGGLIAHRITNISGSSQYFLGGVVAYSNQVKNELLGVPADVLGSFGAVSEQTVLAMAAGVRRLLKADIGLAISGIAGPSGGTPEKPVGLTWIGLSSEKASAAYAYNWPGDRLQVKEQSAEQALRLLLEYIGEK
jgi:PncC family amidohydrolase